MRFLQWLLKFPRAILRRWRLWFSFLHDVKESRWVFWPLLLIPTIACFVLLIILPLRNFKQQIHRPQPGITHQYLTIEDSAADISQIASYSSQLFRLKLDELFLNSQLIMGRGDSIGLILNLSDSTISLYLRGVNLRSCPVFSYTMNHAFKHLTSQAELFHWLSRPFVLKEDWATIPKVPITIRKAPRDTIEAQKYKIQPAAPARPDVYFTLKFDRNLILKVHQVEPISLKSPRGLGRIALYHLKSYIKYIAETFVHLYHLKLPEHHYSIEITIAKNDAIAIYRAIPMHAELITRLPDDH